MEDVADAIDRLAFGAGRGEPAAGSAPAFRRILVALDASETSRAAMRWAIALAREFQAPVVAAHALPPPYTQIYDVAYGQAWPLASEYEAVKTAGRRLLDAGVVELRAAGVEAEGVLPVGSAPREIARVADAQRADLVILGSHGRGPAGRALLGSVSDGVRNRTRASVLIARGDPPPRSVLAGVDGSRASRDAARLALRLAKGWGVPATLAHAIEPLEPGFLLDEATLSAMDLPAPRPGVAFARRSGPAGRVLAQMARESGAGLVVVGARGFGASSVMGSTASALCHQSTASVLVHRGP